jgi:exodeoxyribonuclease VII small subunit
MAAVKARLDEIAKAVADDELPLDDALAYYEEAVKLGMRASELMEADLVGRSDEAGDGGAGAEDSHANPEQNGEG